jgi:hypothetical protein
MNSNNYDLHVYINHFVPPKSTLISWLQSFVEPRLTLEYLKSWLRLIKHGSRGHQPWKTDVMTKARRRAVPHRVRYLLEVINSLNDLRVNSLIINIFTNSVKFKADIGNFVNLKNISVHVYEKYKSFNTFHNSPWITGDSDSPWHLSWEHKAQLSKDIENGSTNSLFLYLDDDIKFTQKNLEYWLENRNLLAKHGLVPGYTLMEFSSEKNDWVSLSTFTGKTSIYENLCKIFIDNTNYVSLENPYSASFLLDQELGVEYKKSKAISETESRKLTDWDIGARAAMGLIYVNVPLGFQSRSVVPVVRSGDFYAISEGATLHHLPDLYSSVSAIEKNLIPINKLIKAGGQVQ